MKTTMTKIGLWIKLHWSWFVLGVLGFASFILFLFKQKEITDLIANREKQTEDYRVALNNMKEAEQQARARNEQIQKTLDETLKKIEEAHATQLVNISTEQEKQVKKIVEEHHNNPTVMAQRVNEMFGFPIYQGTSQQ